ncbi:MAG: hypothetical protein ACXADH_08055 [Candidatus Kariarchaeaceae archaeon]|jgi:hypothetical protein
MAAAQSSIYEKFIIISKDGSNRADIAEAQFRVISFDYYENILSPFITGTFVVSSTSGTAKSKDDTQNRSGTLGSSLPLRPGCTVLVKIKNEIGEELDFSSEDDEYKKLYVLDVRILTEDSTSETLSVRFASRTAYLNTTNKVVKSFRGKISDSVRKILKEELSFQDDKINIDPSSNSYSFLGMNKKPVDLIAMLCIRTIPANVSNPGYFCYETKSGFNFISADTMITQDPFERTYTYTGQPIATAELKDDSNNYKVSSFTTTRHQDLLSQVSCGVFSSKNVFFNPTTCVFTEIDISVEDKKLSQDPKFSTLGKKDDPPPFLFGGKNGKRYHRIQSAIFDVGTDSGDVNNSPELYYAAGSTRYNLLFSQVYSATVPCNVDLEAGHLIRLEVESKSQDKEQGPDQSQSGNYIIQAVHHHFEPNKSTTSMNLIRDSYGLHFTKSLSAPAVSAPKSSARPSPKPKPLAKEPEKSATTDTRSTWQKRLDARRGKRN